MLALTRPGLKWPAMIIVGAFVAIACSPEAATPAPTEAPATATEAPAAPTEAPATATEAPATATEAPDDGSAATEAPAAAAVSVEVAGLAPGDVVTDNTLDLTVAPVGYEFDPTGIGKGPADEPSHYHVVLDGGLINAFAMPDAAISLQNVASGEHELLVVPATNTHAPLTDGATKIAFDYQPDSPLAEITAAADAADLEPAISIVSPAAGETISGAFEMAVETTDFTLSDDLLGKPNVDGFGHWHVFFDEVGMPNLGGMSGSDTMMVMADGLEPGTHTLFAVLVDNLHAPFDPPIVTKVEVEVADDGSTAAAGGGTIDVSLQEWKLEFEPAELTLEPGTYTFNATNDGTVDHALQLTSGLSSAATPDTSYAPGETESFTADLAPGTYEIFCPVAGHKAAGMVATITVTG